jgi:glycosyltransferase involved in cell wall biosynthesis
LATSPPNEALISAYLELGFQVDVYSPSGAANISSYGNRVKSTPVEYGISWMVRNVANPRWRQYQAFSGTTENPMAVAGILGILWRRPVITLADEIRTGSYRGNRSERWKHLCRLGMRRSTLTIVNDALRVDLQRTYVKLPISSPIIFYPGSFRKVPEAADRNAIRNALAIPPDALVLGYSGTFSQGNGGLWLVQALQAVSNLHVLGQLLVTDPLVSSLLDRLAGSERLHRVQARLEWTRAWAEIVAADIGMVVYLQDAPQFQNMGISSNRLCMFLAMGVPVIASRQASFEFIEQYDCGVLVSNEAEFIAAIHTICSRLDEMKANALRCSREYVDAAGKYLVLRDAVAQAINLREQVSGF